MASVHVPLMFRFELRSESLIQLLVTGEVISILGSVLLTVNPEEAVVVAMLFPALSAAAELEIESPAFPLPEQFVILTEVTPVIVLTDFEQFVLRTLA
jgi:hypothetical protein